MEGNFDNLREKSKKKEEEYKVKRTVNELLQKTIERCLQSSHSGLILPLVNLFEELSECGEKNVIQDLKLLLAPLGMHVNSPNFSWDSDPDKQQLIDTLLRFYDNRK